MATGEKAASAERIVRQYMMGSLVPGVIPMPWVGAALVSAVQLKMLHRLAKHYDTPFSGQLSRSAIAALAGGVFSGGVAAVSSNLLKAAPVVGPLVGQISMVVFGGASTYALGRVFIQHFETGGTLLTFDAKHVDEHYRQQYEVGKEEMRRSFAGVKP